jgi:hypothetical protein
MALSVAAVLGVGLGTQLLEKIVQMETLGQ